jgi:hypothetical protein
MEEFEVVESAGVVAVCLVLSDVEAGFIQDQIWVNVSTEQRDTPSESTIGAFQAYYCTGWKLPNIVILTVYIPLRARC